VRSLGCNNAAVSNLCPAPTSRLPAALQLRGRQRLGAHGCRCRYCRLHNTGETSTACVARAQMSDAPRARYDKRTPTSLPGASVLTYALHNSAASPLLTQLHNVAMCVAIAAAASVGAGIIMPMFALVFGGTLDSIQLPTAANNIDKYTLYLVYLAIASLLLNITMSCCWAISSERQIRRMR
jgi:ABC transporter transmembrane region